MGSLEVAAGIKVEGINAKAQRREGARQVTFAD